MSTTQTQTLPTESKEVGSVALRGSYIPLKPTGALNKFKSFEVTPVIGREYPEVQLRDLLNAKDSDELLRELAIIISQRNVVFFRNQDITIEEQKTLANRLGELSGRPAASGLHVHPLTEPTSELGDEVSIISSARRGEYVKAVKESRLASSGWHTDITFEPAPSDFAILKIHTLPESGGDTLWASAYEAYDRLSPAYQRFLEGLTAVHEAKKFLKVAELLGNPLRDGIRGNPLNKGAGLEAVHPVVRTNPVTGWKGLFINKGFTKSIVELSKDESDKTLEYLFTHIAENHDLQVRFKWNKNDIAIWSNTSTFHTATWDYENELRVGDRTVSIGEKPFYDAQSQGRRAALGLPAFVY
ncbi:taurine catabolism dioxygenase [Meredithblackwellia eburnea MCA 4105]